MIAFPHSSDPLTALLPSSQASDTRYTFSNLPSPHLKPSLSLGMGYTDDVPVSRMYRDLRLMSIGGGADEVMLNIICKFMGTEPGMRG